MRSEHAHRWKESTGRFAGYGGLLAAIATNGKFCQRNVGLYWKADEYGWPTKTKARLVAREDEQKVDLFQ